IPSYNEEKNISFVASQIDKGLVKYFPNKKCVIVNADNFSSDNTKNNFLTTKTKTPKLYLTTPKGIKGKGNNLRNLFKLILKLDAKAAMIADADLKSITPEWVKALAGPVLDKKFDFILPLYERHPYDATITNHICYPLVYGLLKTDARQPIGGDFAFNQKIIKLWLSKNWDNNVKNFGVDIFMTLNALFGDFKTGQAFLGQKIHRSSGPKLDSMFDQVVLTMFKIIWENEKRWRKKITETKKIPVAYRIKKQNKRIPPPSGLERIMNRENLINAEQWADILYGALSEYGAGKSRKKIISEIEPLYLDRAASFIKRTKRMNTEETNRAIEKQAEIFFKKREKVL
ncbi:MAG: glycosyltransferase, partial [bacterium]|nr:glycosyltransferase [bacterium]